MRTYRVTLFRAGEERTGQPLHYLGEVESHQRGDDVIHQAMMAHPDLVPLTCTLVVRGKLCARWPTLAQGTLH
jgi:hypothetical protein